MLVLRGALWKILTSLGFSLFHSGYPRSSREFISTSLFHSENNFKNMHRLEGTRDLSSSHIDRSFLCSHRKGSAFILHAPATIHDDGTTLENITLLPMWITCCAAKKAMPRATTWLKRTVEGINKNSNMQIIYMIYWLFKFQNVKLINNKLIIIKICFHRSDSTFSFPFHSSAVVVSMHMQCNS